MNQWVSWYYVLIVFITKLFCCSILLCQEQHSILSIAVLNNNIISVDEIKALIVEPRVLSDVSFEADIFFQKEEFFYLTDFVVGELVDASTIIRAVEYLNKKNKFSTITIDIDSCATEIALHFSLHSFWTFKKIKINGIFQGKNIFTQLYLMNRGDVFSQQKHSHSIMKIKELLEQEGYYLNTINSAFEYDRKTKEVTVRLLIYKGKHFSFGNIKVIVMGDDSIDDYAELQKNIARRLSHRLSSQKYKKEVLNREALSLTGYLGRKGFLQTRLELEEHKHKDIRTVDLVWKITIHQKRAFVFFGNRFFSKTELLEKMLAFGRSAWLMPATLLAEEIFNAYKRKGFWNAEIVGQEEKERCFFVIQEKSRSVIKDVEIQNLQSFDSNFLKRRCFKKFLNNKYYDQQLHDEAIKLLISAYLNAGFLSATIIDSLFVPLDKENEYKLVITLDEGRQSYIASVVIDGYQEIQTEGPFKRDFYNEKVLFDTTIIDEQRVWLMHCFQKMGYMHPRIKSHINMHEDEISIVWTIDPGENVRFGKTIIAGSFQFPFGSLMTLIGYKQGEKWDQEKIKQTFKLLKDLDIFESINLMPDYTDSNQEKSVILKIHADDTYEVRTRAGLELQHVRKYQTFNGLTYKIGGTGLMRNPFNVGDVARLDLDFARSHREVIARYKRPFFFKVPLICTMQAYSISYDQPGFIGSVNDIYTLLQNGFLCELQRKTNMFECGVRIGFEGMVTKIKDPSLQKSLIKAIDFQPQLVDQTVPFIFIEPTVMCEYLDNPLNPTSGSLTLCSLKAMIPIEKKYKNTLFVKLLCEQSLFVPLQTVVAAFRLRFGHIFYRKLSAIMPSERFYLGGSHSLRGYEMDLAPPLGVFVDEETNEHIVPRGGKSMLNINAELRFPIYKKIGGVVFQDFGILSGDTFNDFKPQNFLGSTGFGARLFTPLGPLRFDIGWRWRKQTSLERSFAWFLTFGQAF